jgi:hypothetical protein
LHISRLREGLPLFTELPRGLQAVEKVVVGLVESLKSGLKRPKTDVFGAQSRAGNGFEIIFQHAGFFSEVANRKVLEKPVGIKTAGAVRPRPR